MVKCRFSAPGAQSQGVQLNTNNGEMSILALLSTVSMCAVKYE